MGEGAGQLAQAEGPCSSPVPGMTVMVFRARSTRKVLSAEMLPKSTNSVRYLGGGWGQGLCQSQGVGNGAERAPERGFPRNPCIWGYRGDARGQVRDHRLLRGLRGAKDTAGALLRRGGVARVAQLSQWVGAWGPGRMYCVGGTQMDSLQVRPGE